MENQFFAKTNIKRRAASALGAAAALALIAGPVHTFADPPVTMAPPVDSGDATSYNVPADDGRSYSDNNGRSYSDNNGRSYSDNNGRSYSDNNGRSYSDNNGRSYSDNQDDNDRATVSTAAASQDTVFNWSEVPENQQVPVRRAVFDRGGYQLYDTVGETIVVPFTNSNLYVMKFAVSPDSSTYFVNTGEAPVLYIPRGSFLENAAVPGARWYPFSEQFHPAQPVFLGIAPSWDDYCTMGWYPDMAFYGGYYGYHPFVGVGLSFFSPSFGLSIFFGGHHYDGWAPYHRYYSYHPAPYRVTIVNNNFYRFGGRPFENRSFGFRGAGHAFTADRGFGAGHNFGAGRSFGGERTFGGGRVFNGTGHSVYAHRTFSGDRDFAVNHTNGGAAGHTLGTGGDRSTGGHAFHGTEPSFGGENRTYSGGRTFGGGQSDSGRTFGGNRTFGGGARPALQGGQDHSFGGRTFGGGQNYGGGSRSSGGGGSRGGAQPQARSNGGGGSHGGDNGGNRGGGGNHSGDRH